MTRPTAFVCFKWRPNPGYRSRYSAEQPNVLRNMLERNVSFPHELVCVTDNAQGLDPRIRAVPLWDTFSRIPNPSGRNNPSCYRRLPLYDREFALSLGLERFVMIDLDVVLVRDCTALFDIEDDFRIWGDTAKGTPYNGSLVLMTAGARQKVWSEFDPIKSPLASKRLGYIGSDQGWIGACLGTGEKKWSAEDGVYSYRNDLHAIRAGSGALPGNARIVIFHGHVDPWDGSTKTKHQWVQEHYR